MAIHSFTAKKKADNTGELQLYGDIGPSFWGSGIDDKTIASSLKKLKADGATDLHVYINSVGGSVFHGIAIYNQIKRWDGKKHIYVDGIAASIASVIAMAGDEIHMGMGSSMMIHEPSGVAHGNAKDMEKGAEVTRKLLSQMVDIYVSRTGIAESEIRSMLAAETWMKSSEAVEKKFATDVVDDSTWANATTAQMRIVATASPLYASYRNVPDELKQFLASVPENPAQPRTPEEKSNMEFMKMVARALGLSENATEAEILVALSGFKARASQVDSLTAQASSIGEFIAITGQSTPSAALGTVAAWKASHAQVEVLMAEKKVRAADQLRLDVDGIVAKAVADGQITPAMKEYWTGVGNKDLSQLQAYVAVASKTASTGAPINPKPTDAGGPPVAQLLTEAEQEAIFAQAGITDPKMQAKVREEVGIQAKQLAEVGLPIHNRSPGKIKGMG